MAGEGWPVRCLDTDSSAAKMYLLPMVGPLGPAPPACPVTDTTPDRRALSTRGQAAMGQQEGHPAPTSPRPYPSPALTPAGWSSPPPPFWVRAGTGREQPPH